MNAPLKKHFPTFARLFSWRNIRRCLITLAAIVTLIALFYTVERVRGQLAWKHYVAKAEAGGETVEIMNLVPPEVPDNQNFAMIPLFRETLDFRPPVDSRTEWGPYVQHWPKGSGSEARPRGRKEPERPNPGNWRQGERVDLKSWQNYYRWQLHFKTEPEFPVSENPQSPARDVLLALTKYQEVLEQIAQGSERPYSRFPIDYEANLNALLPQLSPIRGLTRTLELKALAHLAADEVDQAYENVMLGFYLRDSVKAEPLIISHLVRIAIHNLMLQPVWEGIADGKWTEAQLKTFQELFEKDNWVGDSKLSMRGEKALAVAALDALRRGVPEAYSYFVDENSIGGDVPYRWFPTGWYYQNMVRLCTMEDKYFLDALDEKEMRIDLAQTKGLDTAFSDMSTTPYNIFTRMLVPALSKAIEKFARAQAASDLAALACAIERYRLAGGALPESLDALVPDYINELPHDVLNGEPLIYRLKSDSEYVLYSMGVDGNDDGGSYPAQDRDTGEESGDWVWSWNDSTKGAADQQ